MDATKSCAQTSSRAQINAMNPRQEIALSPLTKLASFSAGDFPVLLGLHRGAGSDTYFYSEGIVAEVKPANITDGDDDGKLCVTLECK